MIEDNEKFNPDNKKRLVLVADDEMINREILGQILASEYEVLFATDGTKALKAVRDNRNELALILLDVLMPGMNGLDLLKVLRNNADMSQIPIIVLTSEQDLEVKSLELGAIDFIPKPYPRPEVILARVKRTIQLSEDRKIIQSTERDTLTGLYIREYFFRYAEQFDHQHKEIHMDAILLNVNHFHIINERHGKEYGNTVLCRIADRILSVVKKKGGYACRLEGDTFLIYCRHGLDYEELLESVSVDLYEDSADSNNRVRMRMGVYPLVDRNIDIERRFDRAKMAADTGRKNYEQSISFYDNQLHEEKIYTDRLLDDFQAALAQKQFEVYYQPKFNVQENVPVLASAEALIRWKHPEFGMISPGLFIPLLEENSLIQQLDHYVWREAASQIRQWKDRFGIAVPISVNVSRIDMYDPNLIGIFVRLMEEFRLSTSECLLEITESAYTNNSAQIINTVKQLRKLGFRIEMDDFGSGYSSLNMLSTLPIDALKLDMKFIRTAFSGRRDTRMIELVIDIADYLSVPVIAEGVETEEQMNVLKGLGCDIVQGYYFSKPVPAAEFEKFITEKLQAADRKAAPDRTVSAAASEDDPVDYNNVANTLLRGFENIYYVDINTDHYVKFSSKGRDENVKIQRSGWDFFNMFPGSLAAFLHEDDKAGIAASLQKDKLLSHLKKNSYFSVNYRTMVNNRPVYYNLKAVRPTGKESHYIVIGVSNVDELMHKSVLAANSQSRVEEFYNIAQALSSDFESIYYVDMATEEYTEFTAQGSYETLHIELSGTNFFAECQKNMQNLVYPDDLEKVSALMHKDVIEEALQTKHVYTLDYRLIIGDSPEYYRLKIVRSGSDDDSHIVVGISNINSQMNHQLAQQKKLERAHLDSATYGRIAQALAKDFYTIYYINIDTNAFIEFSSTNRYKELQIETNGIDFFESCLHNVPIAVHEEDVDKVLYVLRKDTMLQLLEKNGSISTSYRLILSGECVYVNMKIILMDEEAGGSRHVIVGVSNIDAQMKREQEFAEAQAIAMKDSLTGVKNKRSYTMTQTEIDNAIKNGEVQEFAIVICDVNGLQQVNDTQGLTAGEQMIRDACEIICQIFRHSPVYRIGSDEFAAILQGRDYNERAALMQALKERVDKNKQDGGVIIASGLSEFDPLSDKTVEAVFGRADINMYENKLALKKDN